MSDSDSEDAGSRGDHRLCVYAVIAAARTLLEVDLPAALAAAEHALSVGPFIDPTAFREKSNALREDLELFKAAAPLFKLASELKAGALERLRASVTADGRAEPVR